MTPSSAFSTLISMKQGEKCKKLWLNTYVIASAKEIDALNITLFNSCINSTNVHHCHYCTKYLLSSKTPESVGALLIIIKHLSYT